MSTISTVADTGKWRFSDYEALFREYKKRTTTCFRGYPSLYILVLLYRNSVVLFGVHHVQDLRDAGHVVAFIHNMDQRLRSTLLLLEELHFAVKCAGAVHEQKLGKVEADRVFEASLENLRKSIDPSSRAHSRHNLEGHVAHRNQTPSFPIHRY